MLELLKYTEIEKYIKKEIEKEQINILKETIKDMVEDHTKNIGDILTLNDSLEDFSLLIGNEEYCQYENEEDKVKLMTVHQAKGLEFKYVFTVGLEEGCFP